MTGPAGGAIDVRPLTPELAQDYLAFFDHRSGPAFADNTGWAKCYCQFYHTPMAARIATGEMDMARCGCSSRPDSPWSGTTQT